MHSLSLSLCIWEHEYEGTCRDSIDFRLGSNPVGSEQPVTMDGGDFDAVAMVLQVMTPWKGGVCVYTLILS